jgi:hypothetical protein
VQIGDNNVQHNVWNIVWEVNKHTKAASLEVVAPYHAASLIRAMAYDDAVDQLGAAEVEPAAKILDVLLKTDEALAVSLLADISREKADGLVAAVTAESPGREWLDQLPEAAEAIGKRGEDPKWAEPGLLQRADYYRPASNPGRRLVRRRPGKVAVPGYRRIYEGGRIYWSREGSARAITGAILDHYMSSGECDGRFGIPTSEATPRRSSAGKRWVQRFSSGAIYCHDSQVIPATQAVVEYLDGRGGADQFYPLDVATAAKSLPGTHGWIQRFQGSSNASSETIYDVGNKAYGVGEIESFYNRLEGTRSWLGYPMSNVRPFGSTSMQDFEGGTVFAGVPAAKIVAVPVATMHLLSRDDGILQPLGFPVTAEEPAGSGGDRWQFFENGVVTLRGGKREVWGRANVVG